MGRELLHSYRANVTRLLAVICVATLQIGCGTVSEQQRYERENRQVLKMERYEAKRRACRAAGGFMVLPTHGGLSGERAVEQYEDAYCVRPETF